MSTLSRRRRGGDSLLLKQRSNNNDKNNDPSITSASKNNKDYVRYLLGLRTTVEFLAQPEAVARQEAALWTRGQEAEA
jgi:hypothetical protein